MEYIKLVELQKDVEKTIQTTLTEDEAGIERAIFELCVPAIRQNLTESRLPWLHLYFLETQRQRIFDEIDEELNDQERFYIEDKTIDHLFETARAVLQTKTKKQRYRYITREEMETIIQNLI